MKRVIVALLILWGAPAPFAQVFDPSNRPAPPTDPGSDADGYNQSQWKWTLGDLDAKLKYVTMLQIQNFCETEETANLFITDFPELKFALPGCDWDVPDKTCTTRVPPGGLQVEALIDLSSADDWYVVDPMAPWATPRPFRRVVGELVVVHPNPPGAVCLRNRDTYEVSFNVGAQRRYPDPEKPGPEKTVGAGPCEVWWNTGEKPSNVKPDQDCTSIIRPLALGYRERVLPPYIEKAPHEWTWLPQPGRISEMAAADLVAMKVTAERQIAR